MPTSIITIKQKLDSHLGDTITVVAQAGTDLLTKNIALEFDDEAEEAEA